jgi:hypothetical protein
MRHLLHRIASEIGFFEVLELAIVAGLLTWRAFTAIGMLHHPAAVLSIAVGLGITWRLLARLPHTRPFRRSKGS